MTLLCNIKLHNNNNNSSCLTQFLKSLTLLITTYLLNVQLLHSKCILLHASFLTFIAHLDHSNTLNPSISFHQFQPFLSSPATTLHEFIITGDFNIHLDDLLDSSSQQFTDLLLSTNLIQHVSVSIHKHNDTLDLVITSFCTNLLQQYHNLLLLYLITFLLLLISTLHLYLLQSLLNLPFISPKTLRSSNSTSTSLHTT